MKIAGRKNDGAWFRTNAAIHGNANLNIQPLTLAEREQLIAFLIDKMSYADAFYNDMIALAAQAGVGNPESIPPDVNSFIAVLINAGIPRQIWNGKLTFTTYEKIDTGVVLPSGATLKKYVPNYSESARNFANELRGYLKQWLFARRQVNDVFNLGDAATGNPGGIPDADPAT